MPEPSKRRWTMQHILVVDDDPGIRAMVAQVLALADYEVKSVANRAEALQAIDQQPPAAMLLDMQMPVLDGWGVAHRLQEQGRHVPTVVMTAAVDAPRWCAEIGGGCLSGQAVRYR